jgi:hypothetical protein
MDEVDDRRASGSTDEASDEIVMFFLGPDGAPLDRHPAEGRRRTIAEVRQAFRQAIEADRLQDPSGLRRLGPRPVQGTGRPAKPGYRDEIVLTARSDPGDAVEAVTGGGLFEPAIRRLEVDAASLTRRRYELAWDAVVDVHPWQHRSVRVRLYASPSLNVTVLSLTPHRQRRAARRGFLRVGNRVMNDLRDRLDGLVEERRRANLLR